MPGGETKVWRMLERTVMRSEGVPGVPSCRITPMPSLLADPSQPRAMRRGLEVMSTVMVTDLEVLSL